jgi:chromosome segregation ATPase
MEAEQLKLENDQLKGAIQRLSYDLQQADKQVLHLQNEVNGLLRQSKDLLAEVDHLNMKLNNGERKDDTRYY